MDLPAPRHESEGATPSFLKCGEPPLRHTEDPLEAERDRVMLHLSVRHGLCRLLLKVVGCAFRATADPEMLAL